jgi:hypothetical protein
MIIENHPVACIFPMMDTKSYEELKQDIAINGVHQSGLLYQGKVLDGRNRYRACCELDIQMSWQEVELGEPEDIAKFDAIQHVMTHNLHRRHLKQSQRAMIAAKMATLTGSGRPEKGSNDTFISDAAALLSVSEPTVKRAKHVLANGCKPLIEAVEDCQITVSMAEKLCKAEPDKREQSRLVKEGKEAIRLFLNPTPHPSPEVDDEVVSDEDPVIQDKYESPIVEMFKHADYRLNTLKMLVNQLSQSERIVMRDWLKSSDIERSKT